MIEVSLAGEHQPLKIFDAMLEMRSRALEQSRIPQRWKINEAAFKVLMMDDRFINQRANLTESWFGGNMLGIPITRLDGQWRKDTPQVELVLDDRHAPTGFGFVARATKVLTHGDPIQPLDPQKSSL